MTWGNTPLKTFTDEERNKEDFKEEEFPDFLFSRRYKKRK